MIKVVICILRCQLLAPLILLSWFNGAYAQSEILRTQNGLMAIYTAGELCSKPIGT